MNQDLLAASRSSEASPAENTIVREIDQASESKFGGNTARETWNRTSFSNGALSERC